MYGLHWFLFASITYFPVDLNSYNSTSNVSVRQCSSDFLQFWKGHVITWVNYGFSDFFFVSDLIVTSTYSKQLVRLIFFLLFYGCSGCGPNLWQKYLFKICRKCCLLCHQMSYRPCSCPLKWRHIFMTITAILQYVNLSLFCFI